MWFFILIFIVYLILNAWIIWWFWRALRGGSRILQVMACLVLTTLSLSYLFLRSSEADSWMVNLLFTAGAFWLGIFFYVFLMVLVAEMMGMYKRKYRRKMFDTGPHPQYGMVFIMLAFALAIAGAGWFNAINPRVTEVDLTIKTDKAGFRNLPNDSITIAAIADMHLGKLVSPGRLRDAVEKVKVHNPDLLLFLGDVVDDHIGLDEAAMQEIISGIKPAYGTWGILGNHEYHAGDVLYSLWVLNDSGIGVLRDDYTIIADGLLLVGRDDYSRHRLLEGDRASLEEILSRVPEKHRNLPVILMDHQPRNLDEAAAAGVALELSGHTHYGQIWPVNYIIEKLYENPRGHARRENTHYYVSTGTGTWGPPIRTSARPEVLLIRIRFTDAGE